MSQTDNGAPKLSEEWRRKNERRINLIQKKYREGLTAEEKTELEILQKTVVAQIEALYPRPPLDWEKLEALERELRQPSPATEGS